jgi:hypothetical protein
MTTEVAATEVAEAQERKNGITHPKKGTKIHQIWKMADELSVDIAEDESLRAEILKRGEAMQLNRSTISTQLGRWRRFHSLLKAQEQLAS